jgi:hypothetical protein
MISQAQNNQKDRPPKQILQMFVVGIIILMSLSALVWILNSEGIVQGAWSTIFNIVFIVFSVILGLLQWHTQTSAGPTTPSTLLSVLRYRATNNKPDWEIKLESGDDKVALIVYSDRYLYVYAVHVDARQRVARVAVQAGYAVEIDGR